jgi:DNA invertase Pin-like site-specific DNA recombinase
MKVGYARIAEPSEKAKPQTDALKKAGCRKIFVDEAFEPGQQGSKLNEAIDACAAGDAFVVTRLSRFGGSLKNAVETVNSLREKGIALVSLEEGIDSAGTGGEGVMRVFEALAIMQKETMRERTKAGIATARSRGKNGGRPKSISEKTMAKARSLRHESGMSVTEICKKLKIGRSSFYRYSKQ